MGAPRFGAGRPAYPRPRSCRSPFRQLPRGRTRHGQIRSRDECQRARRARTGSSGPPGHRELLTRRVRRIRRPGANVAGLASLAAGTYDTAPHHRNPSRCPSRTTETRAGPGQQKPPGRATPAKCRSITNPPCGRDRIAAISWQQKVGPQPGRAANSQRGPELPRTEGPDRVSTRDWPGSRGGGRPDPGSSTGLAGPPAQSAARGQYAGPRPVKAPG